MIYGENVVNHIPLVIYDEDQSALNRKVIQAYADADRFVVTDYVQSEEEMKAAILNGYGKAALEIPRDFAKNVKHGDGADCMLMVNSANNMFGNATIAASQEIARNLEVSVATSMLQSGGLLPAAALNNAYPVRLGVRITGDPANGYAAFMLGGLMLNGLQIGIMVALSPLLITELLRRRYDERYPSWLFELAGFEVEHPETMQGYGLAEIMLAKTTVYWSLAMCSYLLVLLGITQGLGIDLHAPLWQLLLLAGIFILAAIGFCFFFSSFFPAELPFVRAAILYPVPCFIFSGYTWPIESMGPNMQTVAQFFPLTHFSNTVRELFLIGSSPSYTMCLEKLGGLILLFFLIGGFLYRRNLSKRREALAASHATRPL